MPMMGTTTKGGTTAAAATDKRIIKEQTTADVVERVAIEQEGRSGAAYM
jgi:Fe-S cluster assembly iron-binding protein IscA